jgi:hypothetical protein
LAIVWACPLDVETYAAAGRAVDVPRPACPGCRGGVTWRGWYERDVRAGAVWERIWVRRVACAACRCSHAVLPSFCLVGRRDAVEVIGQALVTLALTAVGVRPASAAAGVPVSTLRGWWSRFRARTRVWAAVFASLCATAGVRADAPASPAGVLGLVAAACAALTSTSLGSVWQFVSIVTGGTFLSTTTSPLLFLLGGCSVMPPVPP